MGKKFGFERNKKNYKVLNNKVRVIQGDGVNVVSHRKILEAVVAAGWSAENLAFGSGGALLQKVNRDTFAFAMKASYVKIDNKEFAVYKKPKANAVKASKRGRLALVKDKASGYKTVPESEADKYESGNLLIEVFRNGELLVDQNFKDIKLRAELPELL
jgi:nicotinamide phosphoribosyltransferase